jgi:hypothetical protein
MLMEFYLRLIRAPRVATRTTQKTKYLKGDIYGALSAVVLGGGSYFLMW